ncbi:hypothetical protein KIH74_20680 [Kineosporia sp. J2-2]|uniref:Uncharacterized protein n=1 Tax=Kineosporia corallincola TaxID=2835133 RepID=A0ABS5TJW5_9ACTN|nr:hypothetical protein [Kineosporia corallincola]MBT0771366.1 hypothetical protein [Kineosporia corallincola]
MCESFLDRLCWVLRAPAVTPEAGTADRAGGADEGECCYLDRVSAEADWARMMREGLAGRGDVDYVKSLTAYQLPVPCMILACDVCDTELGVGYEGTAYHLRDDAEAQYIAGLEGWSREGRRWMCHVCRPGGASRSVGAPVSSVEQLMVEVPG